MAADLGFHDYVSAYPDADTTELLNDEKIVGLVSGSQKVSQDADDPETAEVPVPAPGQVMDAIDLLRRFAGAAHEGTKDELNALAFHELSVRPILIKRIQANM